MEQMPGRDRRRGDGPTSRRGGRAGGFSEGDVRDEVQQILLKIGERGIRWLHPLVAAFGPVGLIEGPLIVAFFIAISRAYAEAAARGG